MKRILLIPIFLLSISASVWAQKTFQPKQLDKDWKGIIYRKERAVEARLSTNGPFMLGVNFGDIKTYYKSNYYHISLGALRSPREKRKSKNELVNFASGGSFRLGKQNSIFVLRGGMGQKKYLSEKAKRKGIAIGYDYQVGPAMALVKPYYLEMVGDRNAGSFPSIPIYEKYTGDNHDSFLDVNGNTVLGGTSVFRGITETKLVPGLQGKIGLLFSLGAFDKQVKSVEVGVMGDIFIKKLPIMVETEVIKNRPYFINFYVSFMLGSRSD